MENGSRSSRRRFLGGAASAGLCATAGCLDAVLGTGSGQISPEEPSEPREGTAGEFYYLLEENDLEVEALVRDGPELFLTYRSAAEGIEDLMGVVDEAELDEAGEDRDGSEAGEDDTGQTGSDDEPTEEDDGDDGSVGEGDEPTADGDEPAVDPEEMAAEEWELEVVVTVFNEILVKHGTDVEMLVAEVANPIDEQAHGWGVRTEWLEAHNDGEMNAMSLWMNVLGSRVFEEDVEE